MIWVPHTGLPGAARRLLGASSPCIVLHAGQTPLGEAPHSLHCLTLGRLVSSQIILSSAWCRQFRKLCRRLYRTRCKRCAFESRCSTYRGCWHNVQLLPVLLAQSFSTGCHTLCATRWCKTLCKRQFKKLLQPLLRKTCALMSELTSTHW